MLARGERGAADRGEPNGSGLPPPAPILAKRSPPGARPALNRAEQPPPEPFAEADLARQARGRRLDSSARLLSSVVRPAGGWSGDPHELVPSAGVPVRAMATPRRGGTAPLGVAGSGTGRRRA